ncbi:hypothetical protein EZM97_04475 [Dyella soli]|uniref:Uncharacterized protein n=1 Tax=Dyella soli TaxID=522319 RepID=A0A4R0YVT2_9GAMM|nr:hypothetical protein [Dyella soli]TCI12611.1 hypothetical protein EZM97_04475 [Dyella soli]
MLGGLVTLFGFRDTEPATGSRDAVAHLVVTLGGFNLSLFGRAAPRAADAWQRNALLADASCVTGMGDMHACGSLLSAVDLLAWHRKLSIYRDERHDELRLGSTGDCLGMHLQRLVSDDCIAVTVVMVAPGSGVSLHALSDAMRAVSTLKFVVSQQTLEHFCNDVALASQRFPVQHGHAVLPI